MRTFPLSNNGIAVSFGAFWVPVSSTARTTGVSSGSSKPGLARQVAENHVGHDRAAARDVALRAHLLPEDRPERVLIRHVEHAERGDSLVNLSRRPCSWGWAPTGTRRRSARWCGYWDARTVAAAGHIAV